MMLLDGWMESLERKPSMHKGNEVSFLHFGQTQRTLEPAETYGGRRQSKSKESSSLHDSIVE